MSGAALTMVLLAGFVHAVWNLIAKRASGGIPFSALSSFAALLLWAPIGLTVLWREVPEWSGREWGFLAISGIIHQAYYSVLLRGYEVSDLSVVYPVARGTGPLITVIAATVVLQERPSLLGFIGVLIIVLGMLVIATGGSLAKLRSSPNTAVGVQYGLATGLFIATYSVLDGYAVKTVGISPIALDYGSLFFRLAGIGVMLSIMLRHTPMDVRAYVRANRTPALLVGLLSPLSYILVLQAATLTDLSRVAPAREVSMLFAALFAGSLLHEDNANIRLAGAAAIACGVVAVAIA